MLYYARALAPTSAAASISTHFLPSPACSNSVTAAPSKPEVDLSGHWIDGDVIHFGEIKIG